MLDFRPKGGRTTNYFGRYEQRKLLLLVLSVGMLLFLIEEAANPQRWLWLWQAAGQQVAPANDKPHRLAQVEQPPELRRKLAHDEFVAEGEAKEAIPADKKFFPGVRPEFLALVRDDTVFRGAESDAFYHLLKILDETSEDDLRQASIGPVSFTQLFTQPKEYRGDLVTVGGSVRRVLEKDAPQNDYGIARYYQVVIEPDDRAYPVVVYSLGLPEGFPRGENLHETVRVNGFFYKRLAGMSAKKEIMTWPLLVSKTLHWQPVVAAAPVADEKARFKNMVGGLALAVLASLAVMLFLFIGMRRKTRFVMPHARPDQLDGLAGREVAPDVRQQLAELARQEQP